MNRLFVVLLLFFAGCFVLPEPAVAITIPTVYVGNLNNASDPADGDSETAGIQNFGSVPYAYRMGTYDVTTSQYVAFLNGKDAAGTNTLGLYNSSMSDAAFGGISFTAANANGTKYSTVAGRENHPVNSVTWFSAVRFTNWLNNGQGNGDTETGAYLLEGFKPTPTNAATITRQAGATVFLPTENEWYKAAFFNPAANTYFQYPTGSNAIPTASGPTATLNSANFNSIVNNLTDVGSYSGSASPFGAFDMGGNVFQWNEALVNGADRGLRGGMFATPAAALQSSFRSAYHPQGDFVFWGFRVATIPGPQFPGDADYNSVVNFIDLGTLLNNYNQVSKFATGDFNNSGMVDFTDLGILLNNYNQSAPILSPTTAVPEPSTLVLGGIGLLGLLYGGRRVVSARHLTASA